MLTFCWQQGKSGLLWKAAIKLKPLFPVITKFREPTPNDQTLRNLQRVSLHKLERSSNEEERMVTIMVCLANRIKSNLTNQIYMERLIFHNNLFLEDSLMDNVFSQNSILTSNFWSSVKANRFFLNSEFKKCSWITLRVTLFTGDPIEVSNQERHGCQHAVSVFSVLIIISLCKLSNVL